MKCSSDGRALDFLPSFFLSHSPMLPCAPQVVFLGVAVGHGQLVDPERQQERVARHEEDHDEHLRGMTDKD